MVVNTTWSPQVSKTTAPNLQKEPKSPLSYTILSSRCRAHYFRTMLSKFPARCHGLWTGVIYGDSGGAHITAQALYRILCPPFYGESYLHDIDWFSHVVAIGEAHFVAARSKSSTSELWSKLAIPSLVTL